MYYLCVNLFISGDYNGSADVFLYVRTMTSRLPFKPEPFFFKNAFKRFPVNRCYAWHSVCLLSGIKSGMGTLIESRFGMALNFVVGIDMADLNPQSFNAASSEPLSKQERKKSDTASVRLFLASVLFFP